MTEPLPPVLCYPLGVDTVNTRVLECGDGDDVVVLLHGAGSRADRFRPILAPLAARGRHVYAVDFPGHGFASKGADYPYGTPAFARFVSQLLDILDIERLALVGTSLGAHVAACIACEQPDRVTSLVLVGATGIIPRAPDSAGSSARIANTTLEGIRDKLVFLVHDPSLVTDSWVREEARFNSSPGAADALAGVFRYLATDIDADLVATRLASTPVPVLLIWGAGDKWIPADVALATADALGSPPLVFLAAAGHAPYFERPEAFVDVLDEFLRAPAGFPRGVQTIE